MFYIDFDDVRFNASIDCVQCRNSKTRQWRRLTADCTTWERPTSMTKIKGDNSR